jgi:uncharacterized membrane protein
VKGPLVWTRNKFLTGLAVATPMIVTFWILQFVYNTLHDWNETLLKLVAAEVNTAAGHVVFDSTTQGFKDFNTFIGVMIPILVLISLGVLASNVIGRQVVDAVDRLVLRVPFINFIYKLLKQVIDSFKNFGSSKGFKRVVYIDYPVPGAWMIGFVTGQFVDRVRNKNMSVVFVPGALSPMTGLLLSVESERLTDAPMSMEEAMKMIFSGGLVVPTMSGPVPAPAAAPVPTALRPDLPPGLPVADSDELQPPLPVVADSAKTAPVDGFVSVEKPVSKAPLQRLLKAIRGAQESA